MTCMEQLGKCSELKTNVNILNAFTQNHSQHIIPMNVGASKEIIFILVIISKYTIKMGRCLSKANS